MHPSWVVRVVRWTPACSQARTSLDGELRRAKKQLRLLKVKAEIADLPGTGAAAGGGSAEGAAFVGAGGAAGGAVVASAATGAATVATVGAAATGDTPGALRRGISYNKVLA